MTNASDDVTISDVARKYLRVHFTPDVGPLRLEKLLKHFGSIDDVLAASIQGLQKVEGIGPKLARAMIESSYDDRIAREIEIAEACGVRILCGEDEAYPASLRNITDPPICLYVRGRLLRTDTIAVAIVGSRRCSHYGREQAVRFSQSLASAGFTVVSGLAYGIDGAAHRGAVRAGGRTIAVLGNGLATVYPSEHAELADEVVQHGALVSEYPMDTPPDAKNFPPRNRIIIGLSLGVIVVEAGKRSGALITARCAHDYGREVFAVPGHIDRPEFSAGVNGLIRDCSAKLVTCLDDVLDELQEVGQIMRAQAEDASSSTGGGTVIETSTATASALLSTLSAEERAIVDAVTQGRTDADAICTVTNLDISRVTSLLTSLQLKGQLRRLPGNEFALR